MWYNILRKVFLRKPLRLSPPRAAHDCGIDDFAKMPLRASFFSQYNKVEEPEKQRKEISYAYFSS